MERGNSEHNENRRRAGARTCRGLYISEARCDAATCATARFAADRNVVVERAATQGASHAAISTVSSFLFVNNSNN